MLRRGWQLHNQYNNYIKSVHCATIAWETLWRAQMRACTSSGATIICNNCISVVRLLHKLLNLFIIIIIIIIIFNVQHLHSLIVCCIKKNYKPHLFNPSRATIISMTIMRVASAQTSATACWCMSSGSSFFVFDLHQ